MKRRLTLELSVPVRERIEQLKQRSGAESATEVVRRALALYDTVLTFDGKVRLVLKKDDGTEESVLILRDLI